MEDNEILQDVKVLISLICPSAKGIYLDDTEDRFGGSYIHYLSHLPNVHVIIKLTKQVTVCVRKKATNFHQIDNGVDSV